MSAPLPKPIARYLARYVRRRRFFAVARSIALAVTVATAWALACCLVDRLFALHTSVRLSLLAINIFLTLTLAIRPIWRWLFRRTDWNAVAADIEQRDVRFGQLLQTVVSESLASPARRGSPQMLAQLQTDLNTRLQSIRPASLHSMRPLAFDLIIAVSIIGIGASLTRLPWLDLPRLLQRYATPWERISPATTTHLDITPGDAEVIAGDPLTIRAAVTGQGDSPVTLHAAEGSSTQRFTMSPAGDSFAFTFPAVDRDFHYYVTSGDATSTGYDVRALSRPAVTSFEIHYDYPPGIYKPAATTTNVTGLIEGPVGTHVHLAMHLTEAYTYAEISVAGRIIGTSGDAASLVRHAEMVLQESGTYEVHLLSSHRIAGRATELPIRVLPDRAPTVQLLRPMTDVAMSAWDSLPLEASAEDDYGLANWAVVINARGTRKEIPLALAGHPLHAHATADVDLSELALSDGDTVTVTVEASDGEAHTAASSPVHVLITRTSIDAQARQRTEALVRAAEEARLLAEAVRQARQAVDAARSINPAEGLRVLAARSEARRKLAIAEQAAVNERRSLDRAIARSSSAPLSIGLLSLVDDAEYVAAATDAAGHVLEGTTNNNTNDLDWARDRLERSVERSNALRTATEALSRGQLAALLAAEAADLRRLPPAATSQPASAELISRVNAAASMLGIAADNRSASNAMISAAEKALAQLKPVHFAQAADEFANDLPASATRRPFLAQRLQAAAESEALRPDAELVRAADLELAARATVAGSTLPPAEPGRTSPALDHFKQAFPQAIHALMREHDARRQSVLPPDWDSIAAAGAAARTTLRALAAPQAPPKIEQVLAANAQNAELAPTPTPQAPAPLPAAAAETARLGEVQKKLSGKTTSESAKEQALVAQEIEKLRQQQEANRAAEHRAEMARKLAQADDAMSEIAQQIAQVRDAAQVSRDLAARAVRARAAAAQATPQSIEPAEQLANDLAARSQDALKNLAAVKTAVAPETARISIALEPFAPSAAAADAVAKDLAAAMNAQAQAAGGDAAGESAATSRAERTATAASTALSQATMQMLAEDPLAMAAASSAAAANALKSNAPAAAQQRRAAEALMAAREQIVHRTANEAVARLPGISAIITGGAEAGIAGASGEEWTLSNRIPRESHATLSAGVAPEYQDAIRAYFQALGRKQ